MNEDQRKALQLAYDKLNYVFTFNDLDPHGKMADAIAEAQVLIAEALGDKK